MVQEKRTLLKLSASGECVSLRTVSRGFRSPHRFVVLEAELQELEVKRHIISSDIRSFAEMHLVKAGAEGDEDIVTVRFVWLGDTAEGKLSGTEETLRFPWDDFRERIAESRSLDGEAVRLLAMKDGGRPKVEFRSRGHLKDVAGMPGLRKKLGKFLASHLAWEGSVRIMVYDDFVPYSFFFQEEKPGGTGLCGGIILHGQENMEKAYYELYT